MKQVLEALRREGLPEPNYYRELIAQTTELLRAEDSRLRPRDSKGRPGGLIRLPELSTIVVPDLHARMWFLLHVLASPLRGMSVAEHLSKGELQIVCVGDGFHAEARAAERWREAFKEFSGKFKRHRAMDEEMRESLGLMEMVMQLKLLFPDHFHFLKGNHENILNEEGRGNHPFRKFAYEGEMVKEWVLRFYGEEFLYSFGDFEHELPLVAADSSFMISHAEPQRFYSPEELLNFREEEEVVLGLTWTANDGAEEGSVRRMIEEYCTDPQRAHYFGGHRPVEGRYSLRAEDRYVQLHNPGTFSIALLEPDRPPEPERDIIEIPEDREAVRQSASQWE